VIDCRAGGGSCDESAVFGPDERSFRRSAEMHMGAPDTPGQSAGALLVPRSASGYQRVTLGTSNRPKTPDRRKLQPSPTCAPPPIYPAVVRNAIWDLLWDECNLWPPNNGSSAGGNSPAFNSSDREPDPTVTVFLIPSSLMRAERPRADHILANVRRLFYKVAQGAITATQSDAWRIVLARQPNKRRGGR